MNNFCKELVSINAPPSLLFIITDYSTFCSTRVRRNESIILLLLHAQKKSHTYNCYLQMNKALS